MTDLPGYMFDPSWQGVVSLVVAVVLPILVGLLSKASWPGWVRGVLLLFLSAVKSVFESYLGAGDAFDPSRVIMGAAITFMVAVAAYFGVWRGSGVAVAAQNSFVR
jgi:hypothetical protein